MLQIFPTDSPAAVVIRASGTVDALQNAAAVGVLRRMARTYGRIGLLADVCDVAHIDDAALVQGLTFVAVDRHTLHAIAILGDGPWAERLAALAREHTHAHVRRFAPADRADALALACTPAVSPFF